MATTIANGWSSTVKQDETRAEELLFDALGRDPNRSPAHYALGMLRQVQNRLAEADTEMEAAVALDRNNAWGAKGLGQVLMLLGRPEAAIPYTEKAIRLNPYDPNVALFFFQLGQCHLLLGHVDEAIESLGKARAANPRLWYVHQWLAGAFGLNGNLDEARAELAESLRLKPDIDSLAQARAQFPQITNPAHWALFDKTVATGLRRAGFPNE